MTLQPHFYKTATQQKLGTRTPDGQGDVLLPV